MDTFLANVSFDILGIVLFLTTIGELIIIYCTISKCDGSLWLISEFTEPFKHFCLKLLTEMFELRQKFSDAIILHFSFLYIFFFLIIRARHT
jgi:hypothetical protein